MPDPTPQPDFIDEYINCAPLQGEAYAIDSAQVYTFLASFVVGNPQAETKIQAINDTSNGREAFMSLLHHYEGVGVYAVDIAQAEKVISSLFYSGEKRPHMWWDEFERQLIFAYATMDKKEGRSVYSEDMKLRHLMEKVNADFLGSIKGSLNLEMARVPMTLTFSMALTAFRNEVNRKFPPEVSTNTRRVSRQVRQVQRGGRGRGGKGNRYGNKPAKTRTDSDLITLTDGKQIEYHPSFKFPSNVFAKFKDSDKERLRRERAEYRKRKHGSSDQSNVSRELQELRAEFQSLRDSSSRVPPTQIPGDHSIAISQVTTGSSGSTMFGGRNDQAQRRQKGERS
jgi:hypothetical protein